MAELLLRSISKSNLKFRFSVKHFIRNKNVSQNRLYSKGRLYCSREYTVSGISSNNIQFRRFSIFENRSFHSSSVLCEHVLTVPPFAESVTEGDVRWEKGIGDVVAVDEVVCEIETDKRKKSFWKLRRIFRRRTSIPVPSPINGIIKERFVEDGATVKAGQQLCKIELAEGDDIPAPKKNVQVSESAPPTTTLSASEPIIAAVSSPPAKEPTPVSSAPKSTAEVRSTTIKPNIPVAAIKHAASLESATVKLPPQDPTTEISGTRTEQRVKMNRMRQRIAQRLKDAQNTTAMLTTFNEIDMSNIMTFRKANLENFQKKHGIKLGFMSAFLKAAAYALQEQPVVNAVIDGNEIVYRDYIDISVAVATPKGLVVPVIRNVENMTYADIEKTIAELGEKARQNALAVEDMDGGTFTVSNGGVFGSLMGTPIINPPQSAILGMHAVVERPIAVNGQVVIRPMMYVALTYDHRLIDGREAVLFLRKIKAGVENPAIIVAGL